MELEKVKIWTVVWWNMNINDVEICQVINAFSTKEEAVEKVKMYRKRNTVLKYAVRSMYTWFPKE